MGSLAALGFAKAVLVLNASMSHNGVSHVHELEPARAHHSTTLRAVANIATSHEIA